VSESSVCYLSYSLVTWQHVVESTFMQCGGSSGNSQKLKEHFIRLLDQIKCELDSNALAYKDVLPVKFESKVRLTLSVFKVGNLIQ
jgi:hypothetical protein